MPDIPETSTNASTAGSLGATAADAVTMARNIARKWRVAVFPCLLDKRPACPHGFKDASADPDTVQALWERWPGPLIGIATGAVSRVWVVDVDAPRHVEAWQWWRDNCGRLPDTRTYATRSGGLHLYFRDGAGIGNTASRICKGVDTRGDGGYVIFWFAAGCDCLDPSRAAPFPDWLRLLCMPPPAPARKAWTGSEGSGEGGITGILRKLSEAPEGERNKLLYWAAKRLGDKGLAEPAVAAALLPVTAGLGLPDFESRRTITSAIKGGPQ